MFSHVEAVEWAAFAQPEWNKPDSVVNALSNVMTAKDAASCSSAYDDLLYAVGNNHAGTYYPVLLAAMPALEAILLSGQHWPQRAVLCILDDLFASFCPEPGYEKALLPERGMQDVQLVFRRSVHALRNTLEHIAERESPNSALAHDLLSLLNEDAS
jgi:hypothetical protein